MTSRCMRFLTVFGSGTRLNVIRGPLLPPSPASRTACSEVEPSVTCHPRTSAQNRATAAASAQSKVTANSELLTAGVLSQASVGCGQPGSDGGTAAVTGADHAGDVAGLRRGEDGDHAGDLAGLGGP